MASVNKVILIGNLGADPESRFAPSGDAICNIRLATTENWRDKNTGERREATEWHRVSFYGKLPDSLLALGRGNVGPVPALVFIMFVVVVAAQVMISCTRPGKYMQATGANPAAARLAGVSTDRYKILALTLSGLAAAFTGILLTARLGSANPEGAAGFMMDGFASALLGMTVLSMGRANPFGTFIGSLMIGIINNGMTLAGSPYYMQDITKGIIIILSVALTSWQTKRSAR